MLTHMLITFVIPSLTCFKHHIIKVTTDKTLEVAIITKCCIIQYIVHIMQPRRILHEFSQSGQSLRFFGNKEFGEDMVCIEIKTTRGCGIIMWSIDCQLLRCHLIEEGEAVESEGLVGGNMKEITIFSNEFPYLQQTTIVLVIQRYISIFTVFTLLFMLFSYNYW